MAFTITSVLEFILGDSTSSQDNEEATKVELCPTPKIARYPACVGESVAICDKALKALFEAQADATLHKLDESLASLKGGMQACDEYLFEAEDALRDRQAYLKVINPTRCEAWKEVNTLKAQLSAFREDNNSLKQQVQQLHAANNTLQQNIGLRRAKLEAGASDSWGLLEATQDLGSQINASVSSWANTLVHTVAWW